MVPSLVRAKEKGGGGWCNCRRTMVWARLGRDQRRAQGWAGTHIQVPSPGKAAENGDEQVSSSPPQRHGEAHAAARRRRMRQRAAAARPTSSRSVQLRPPRLSRGVLVSLFQSGCADAGVVPSKTWR